jgi:hypothetical protein
MPYLDECSNDRWATFLCKSRWKRVSHCISTAKRSHFPIKLTHWSGVEDLYHVDFSQDSVFRILVNQLSKLAYKIYRREKNLTESFNDLSMSS